MLKNGPIPASFCLFLSFSHYNFNNTNWKKRRWCAWDSNPGMVGADETTELWRHSHEEGKCSLIWCWRLWNAELRGVLGGGLIVKFCYPKPKPLVEQNFFVVQWSIWFFLFSGSKRFKSSDDVISSGFWLCERKKENKKREHSNIFTFCFSFTLSSQENHLPRNLVRHIRPYFKYV